MAMAIVRQSFAGMCIALGVVGNVPSAAAQTVEPYKGNAAGPRVAVIGDSITWQTKEEIHAWLDPDYYVSVDGRSGYTIQQQLPVADVYAAQIPRPSIIVINLGTNDMTQAIPVWASGYQLGTMTGKFSSARCIVLVDINGNTGVTSWNVWAAQFNRDVIYTAAAWDTRIRVVRWDQFVRSYYTAGQPYGELTTDLVHPTELGQYFLGSLIKDQVNACPR
jgi:hypothetical protein